MKPRDCLVKDDPANGKLGDCVRACVASILDRDDVPHFYEKATNDWEGMKAGKAMREWLKPFGLTTVYFGLPGEWSLSEMLMYMGETNETATYLLFCNNGHGDHCVVGQGGTIAHDPAWIKNTRNLKPHSTGVWIIMVIAKT